MVAEGNLHGVLEFGCLSAVRWQCDGRAPSAGAKAKIKVSPGGVPIFCGRNCRQLADGHNLALRPTPTPDKHARARPRHGPGPHAIRAQILAILRDMLNPPPSPPHKPKRPHVRVVYRDAEMVRCQMRAPAREVNIERKTRAPRPPTGVPLDTPKKFNRRTDRRASLRKSDSPPTMVGHL